MSAEDMMAAASRKGWVLIAEGIGRDPGDPDGGNYQGLATKRHYIVNQNLSHSAYPGFGSQKPLRSHFALPSQAQTTPISRSMWQGSSFCQHIVKQGTGNQ
jgi:hypothetical protein